MLVLNATRNLILACLVVAAFAADAGQYLYEGTTEIVKEYTGPGSDGDFESATATTTNRVVKFYNPFCGHCRRFKPDYIAMAEKVPDVAFYAVSCLTHNDKCRDYKIRGWPTLFTFPAGSSSEGQQFQKGAHGMSEEALRAAFNNIDTDPATEQRKLGDADKSEEDANEGEVSVEEGEKAEVDSGDKEEEEDGEKGEEEDSEKEEEEDSEKEGGESKTEEGGDDADKEEEEDSKTDGEKEEAEEDINTEEEESKPDGEKEEEEEGSKTEEGGDDGEMEEEGGEEGEKGEADDSNDESKDTDSRKAGDEGKKKEEDDDDDDDDPNEDADTKAEVGAARARFAEKFKEAQKLREAARINARNPGSKEVSYGSRKGADAAARAVEPERSLNRYQKELAERRRTKDGPLGRFGMPGKLSGSGGATTTVDLQRPPEGATTTMRANMPGTDEFKARREQLIEAIRRSQGKARAEQVRMQLESLAARRAKINAQAQSAGTLRQQTARMPNEIMRPFEKAVTKPRLVEKIPIVKKIVRMSHEEELILDVSMSFIHGLKLGVFKSRSALSEDEQNALEDWLHLVRIALPQEWALHSLIDDLLDNFSTVAKSHEGLVRMIDRHPLERASWSNSCAPPDAVGGGFTCGFWKLLHTISVGMAEHKGGLNVIKARMSRRDAVLFSPELAADAIREYIVNFFPCTDCANHFAERFDDCSYRRCLRLTDKVGKNTDADWKELAKWLWEFHNEVSVRLLHERADKQRKQEQRSSLLRPEQGPGAASTYDEIAALWPSINDCITCFREDGRWNEDAVFVFLEKEYWPPSVLDRRAARLLKFEGEVDREFNLTLALLLLGLVLLYFLRDSISGHLSIQETLIRARTLRHKAGSGGHKRAV